MSKSTGETKPQKEPKYKYVGPGRPTKLTAEVVRKLEHAAAHQFSISETCFYAGIVRDTYYRWIEEFPELSDRLEELRQQPFVTARETIVGKLKDVNVAFKFMEKVKPEEFADTFKMQHEDSLTPEEDKKLVAEFHAKLRANRNKRILEKAKTEKAKK